MCDRARAAQSSHRVPRAGRPPNLSQDTETRGADLVITYIVINSILYGGGFLGISNNQLRCFISYVPVIICYIHVYIHITDPEGSTATAGKSSIINKLFEFESHCHTYLQDCQNGIIASHKAPNTVPKSGSELSLQAQDLMMFISHVAAGLVSSTYISAVHGIIV